jgi:hypothetical protein
MFANHSFAEVAIADFIKEIDVSFGLNCEQVNHSSIGGITIVVYTLGANSEQVNLSPSGALGQPDNNPLGLDCVQINSCSVGAIAISSIWIITSGINDPDTTIWIKEKL